MCSAFAMTAVCLGKTPALMARRSTSRGAWLPTGVMSAYSGSTYLLLRGMLVGEEGMGVGGCACGIGGKGRGRRGATDCREGLVVQLAAAAASAAAEVICEDVPHICTACIALALFMALCVASAVHHPQRAAAAPPLLLLAELRWRDDDPY